MELSKKREKIIPRLHESTSSLTYTTGLHISRSKSSKTRYLIIAHIETTIGPKRHVCPTALFMVLIIIYFHNLFNLFIILYLVLFKQSNPTRSARRTYRKRFYLLVLRRKSSWNKRITHFLLTSSIYKEHTTKLVFGLGIISYLLFHFKNTMHILFTSQTVNSTISLSLQKCSLVCDAYR
jgi:hypothetical protein